jgi:hypothetical protein
MTSTLYKPKKDRKKPDNQEHHIQCACVRWFSMQYPQYDSLLYAIGNGGKRSAITGAIMKREGVKKGVADLFLSVAQYYFVNNEHGHPGLYIEVKAPKGVQSDSQKAFEAAVTAQGYKYVIVRSLDEFMEVVNEYLK